MLAAVAVSAYVPFSWWVLGLLVAGALVLGLILRLREDILEVPISAMLIFSVDSHAAATSRITETLVGAAAGLAAGLVLAPLRVQPAKDARPPGGWSAPAPCAARSSGWTRPLTRPRRASG